MKRAACSASVVMMVMMMYKPSSSLSQHSSECSSGWSPVQTPPGLQPSAAELHVHWGSSPLLTQRLVIWDILAVIMTKARGAASVSSPLATVPPSGSAVLTRLFKTRKLRKQTESDKDDDPQ